MYSRFTLVFAALFSAFMGMSQNVPNAGFEYWHNVGGWFDDPDDWETNNTSIMAATVVEDSSPYLGALAMKVENSGNFPGHAYTFMVYNQHPFSVMFFAKSNILPSDSVSVMVKVYYGGNVVDSGSWYNTSSIANWSLANIPISQSNANMDSLEIYIKAGNQYGTWISVDEFGVNITDVNASENNFSWSLFPNPISELSVLSFENPNKEKFTLTLYNLAGEMVLSIPNITDSSVKIDKGDLTSGLCFFELFSDDKIATRGKFIVE